MKEKQFDPARTNEVAPAPGIAAVSTHNPQEENIDKAIEEQLKEKRQGNGEEKKEGEESDR
jgi:hypothetical protein